ncbi:unnamed protein product [Prunus armeniaca]
MTETETSNKSALSELRKLDAKALDLIQEVVSDKLFPKISNEVKCHRCSNKLHYSECWFKDKVKCHRCSKFGHIARNCSSNIHNKPRPVAYFAENQASETTNMFYAFHSLSKLTNFGVWYVDSGCSNHMTSHELLLSNIDRSLKCKVKMRTGELVQALGKGTLVIELKDGPTYIQNVMIVPSLDENLLSVGQMIENGYWLLFGDFMVNIYADKELKELVANFPMKGNRCFPMKFEFMNLVMTNKAAVEDHSWK